MAESGPKLPSITESRSAYGAPLAITPQTATTRS